MLMICLAQRREAAPALTQTRAFHVSHRRENLVVGGLVVAVSALTAKYALQVRSVPVT